MRHTWQAYLIGVQRLSSLDHRMLGIYQSRPDGLLLLNEEVK
jgi:hypothetical protein